MVVKHSTMNACIRFRSVLFLTLMAISPNFGTVAHADSASSDSYSIAEFEEQAPRHDVPKFGLQLASIVETETAFASIQAEYQIPFIQKLNLGVLGLGISGSMTDANFGSKFGFGGGALVRYQFRYFQNQWIVPMVGYQYEVRSYATKDLKTIKNYPAFSQLLQEGSIHSPFCGLWFLLNPIDSSGAWHLQSSTGIQRTYVTAELRNNFSPNTDLKISNFDFYLGLRIER